jgi:adenylyltransferase/sulfurtransferase
MIDDLHIEPRELHTQMQAGADIQLVDVREDWEATIAHIDGDIHVPLRQLEARLKELAAERPTVVYCHHGIRSLHATLALRGRGFKNVRSLRGGIDRWSTEIDADVPRY